MTRIARSCALALVLAAPVARAHGDVPLVYNVHEVESGGATELHLESNFGVLRPATGGWRLLCEEAVSPGVKWFSLDRDGRILMGGGGGFFVSTDRCNFKPSSGAETPVRWIERVPAGEGEPELVVTLLDVYEPARNIKVSTDRGDSFTTLPGPDDLLVNAIRNDPKTPKTLLATAQRVGSTSYVLFSHDFESGTWSEPVDLGVPGIPRVVGATSDAVLLWVSASSDGNQTHAIWRFDRASGTVALATSLPAAPAFATVLSDGVYVGTGASTPFRSTDDARTFEPLAAPQNALCLQDLGGVRYACLLDRLDKVGLAKWDGAAWVPVMKFSETAGIEDCPAESDVGRTCPDLWDTSIKFLLGVDSPPVPPAPEGCPGCAGASSVLPALVVLLFRRRRAH